jgi:hypothetical protein
MAVYAWVYTGILIALVMNFVSAAYVITKTIDAGAAFGNAIIEGYAATYRDSTDSLWAYSVGAFDLVAILMYSMWSLMMTMIGLWTASDLWTKMDARVIGVKTEGQGGVALDDV